MKTRRQGVDVVQYTLGILDDEIGSAPCASMCTCSVASRVRIPLALCDVTPGLRQSALGTRTCVTRAEVSTQSTPLLHCDRNLSVHASVCMYEIPCGGVERAEESSSDARVLHEDFEAIFR